MTIQTTYTQARANLARLLEQVINNRETVMIRRRHGEDVALIAASELEALQETAHLMRSPANAERLLAALARALANEGQPMTISELEQAAGLGQ